MLWLRCLRRFRPLCGRANVRLEIAESHAVERYDNYTLIAFNAYGKRLIIVIILFIISVWAHSPDPRHFESWNFLRGMHIRDIHLVMEFISQSYKELVQLIFSCALQTPLLFFM